MGSLGETEMEKYKRETAENIEARIKRIHAALVVMDTAIDFKVLEEIETAVEKALGKFYLSQLLK